MSDCNNQGFTCGSCDRDYTVTSSSTVEVDSYDVLLTELLSVQDFLKSNVFPLFLMLGLIFYWIS